MNRDQLRQLRDDLQFEREEIGSAFRGRDAVLIELRTANDAIEASSKRIADMEARLQEELVKAQKRAEAFTPAEEKFRELFGDADKATQDRARAALKKEGLLS